MVKPTPPGNSDEGHSWVTFSIIQEIKLKNPITFEPGYSDLPESAKTALLHVARVLSEHPHLSLRIEGHTDLDETKLPYTQPPLHLSQERGSVALRHLEGIGVHRRRLEYVGRGAECPVATNLTWQGRSQNRRIELHLVDVMKETVEHRGAPQYHNQPSTLPAQSRSMSNLNGSKSKSGSGAGKAPKRSLSVERSTRGPGAQAGRSGSSTMGGSGGGQQSSGVGRASLPRLGGAVRRSNPNAVLKSVNNSKAKSGIGLHSKAKSLSSSSKLLAAKTRG